MSRVNGESTLHRFLVHGPDHDASLVVEYAVIALDGLRAEKLGGDFTVLSPVTKSERPFQRIYSTARTRSLHTENQ
jgi:hypothetical protein